MKEQVSSSNLLKPDVIQAANDNLSNLNLARRDQLSDESLGFGDATWTHIAQMEEEHDIKCHTCLTMSKISEKEKNYAK